MEWNENEEKSTEYGKYDKLNEKFKLKCISIKNQNEYQYNFISVCCIQNDILAIQIATSNVEFVGAINDFTVACNDMAISFFISGHCT